MSSQDMQFADPEWRPPEEREVNANSQEQKPPPPRPINADRHEQPQWQTVPPPQQGYLGPGYAGSQPQTTWGGISRPRPRRRGSPWLWIILAFIIIALMSNGFGRGLNGGSRAVPQNGFGERLQSFKVTDTPTIVINGDVNDITVHAGNSNNLVTIAPENGGDLHDIKSTPDGNTINVSVDQGGEDVGLDVTVPTNANAILQITTTTGSIDVEGVNLTGSSTLSSGSGNVTFNGSLGSGNYRFQSNSGSGFVHVTLPSDSNFHVNANASNNPDQGAISSDFPSVKIQNHGSSTEAGGNVGNASTNSSAPTVTLQTDAGFITLSKSS